MVPGGQARAGAVTVSGGEVVLVRHGETAWSRSGQHTGRTDLPLTDVGQRQAEAVRPALAGRSFALVLASPLQRAWRTAELAGLPHPQADDDLQEWDYGGYEGLTTAQIHASDPDWDLWRGGVPSGGPARPGEAAADVGARIDRVLTRARAALGDGDVALVAHGHCLRVAGARWVGLAAADGRLFALDTAAQCLLGHEHDRPVIRQWNVVAG